MRVKTLKAILIALTVLVAVYNLSFWLPASDFAKAVMKLEFNYHLRFVFLFIQLLVQGAFIYKVFKNDIPQKRKKWKNTLMIIFLGVIGMWFLIVEWQKELRIMSTNNQFQKL